MSKSPNRLVPVIEIEHTSGVLFSLDHSYASGWTVLGWILCLYEKYRIESVLFIYFEHLCVSFPLAVAQEPHSESWGIHMISYI